MSSNIRVKREEEIFEAAEKLFFQKGYENTSMEDIINGTNLSKGGVYYYFKNKEDLCLKLLYSTSKKYNDIVGNMEISDIYENPIENVCNYYLNFLINDIEEIKIISNIYIETRHDKSLSKKINEEFDVNNVDHILNYILSNCSVEDMNLLHEKIVYFMHIFHAMLYYKYIDDVDYTHQEEMIRQMFFDIFKDVEINYIKEENLML